jgi:site-specific DNA-methyltransferase (adenine-specific)
MTAYTTPYYSDDSVTLYLGDCREVTEWLAANVLVTDPPYGIAWRTGRLGRYSHGQNRHGTSYAQPGIAGDADCATRDEALLLWGERPAVVFGSLEALRPSGTRQTLVYRKPPDSGARGAHGGFRRDIEGIYLVGAWLAGLGGRTSVLSSTARCSGSPSGVAARAGHPHAKPVDVMEDLLVACPPGVIADPFAGSGSTLVAARNLGRRAIGVEVEERYCEVIARRLAQDVLPIGDVS